MIGIVGTAGSGKSYLAYELLHTMDAEVMSLATPVYKIAEILVGGPILKDGLYKVGSSEWYGRAILQHVGTQLGRLLDEDIWLSMLQRKIADCDSQVVIVDDVRFLNEFEAVDMRIGIYNEDAVDHATHASEVWAEMLVKSDECDMVLARSGGTYKLRIPGKKTPTFKAVSIEEIINMVKKAVRK